MLGQIYSFDHQTKSGFILGQDGYRYSLVEDDFRFPTNPVVGMIVQYSAEENMARDVVTLDRLPVQAKGPPKDIPIRAGGTDPDPDFKQAAAREMERWRPPLPIPPTPASYEQARTLDPPAPPPAPPEGNFDLWGNFKYCMTTGFSLFRGRARRRSFWGFVAMQLLIFFGLIFIGIALDTTGTGEGGALTVVMPMLFLLATIVPFWAALVRRAHDIGITGWAVLATLIPGIGWIVFLALGLFPGSPNDNRFGPSVR
ncbi:MAG: DUF805 domain-containing protein [Pseudomonadota bacterium]